MNVYFIGGSLDGLTDDEAPPHPDPVWVPGRVPQDAPGWELYTYCPSAPMRDGREAMRFVMYGVTRHPSEPAIPAADPSESE